MHDRTLVPFMVATWGIKVRRKNDMGRMVWTTTKSFPFWVLAFPGQRITYDQVVDGNLKKFTTKASARKAADDHNASL